MEVLLTVEQAAARLQVTPYTVREHLKRGLLRGIKRGRLWRVPESALVEEAPVKREVTIIAVPQLALGYVVERGKLPFVAHDEEPLYEGESEFPPMPTRVVTGHVVRTGRLVSQLEPDEAGERA